MALGFLKLCGFSLTPYFRFPQYYYLWREPWRYMSVTQDLGPDFKTLYDYFGPQNIEAMGAAQAQRMAAIIGTRVGFVLSQIHWKHVWQAAVQVPELSLNDRRILHGGHRLQLPIPDRNGYYAKILEAVGRGRNPAFADECLVMGDCHPGGILVNPSGDVALISWEYASVKGAGMSGDVAQLLAGLHLMLVSQVPDSLAHQALKGFIRQICDTYKRFSFPPGPVLCKMSPAQARLALLVHGREILGLLNERD